MNNNKSNKLFKLTQNYFQDYLSKQRGLSPNTIIAYRDSIKLLMEYISVSMKKKAANIKLADLSVKNILQFLDHLEQQRCCRTITRNQRLASLRTYFNFLIMKDPEYSGEFQRIVKIPLKRSSKKRIEYLEINEVKAILKCVDQRTRAGKRDYLLLQFLYNTGARVQEVCDLRVKDIIFSPRPSVILTGKGSKSRQTPLWQETRELLKIHLQEKKINNSPDDFIFVNQKGGQLTRFGVNYIIRARIKSAAHTSPNLIKKKISAHTFRHTTAMHLLQAGVALNIIQSWLGHVDLSTTNQYVEINMEMKRKALSSIHSIADDKNLQIVIEENKDVISWLSSLTATSG